MIIYPGTWMEWVVSTQLHKGRDWSLTLVGGPPMMTPVMHVPLQFSCWFQSRWFSHLCLRKVPSFLSQPRVCMFPPSCHSPGAECPLPLKAKGSWGWHGVKPLGPNLLGLSTPHPNTEGRLALTSHPFPRRWKLGLVSSAVSPTH